MIYYNSGIGLGKGLQGQHSLKVKVYSQKPKESVQKTRYKSSPGKSKS